MTSIGRRGFLTSLAALAVPLRAADSGFPADALTKLPLWDDPGFLGQWRAPEATRMTCRNWAGGCELFGVKAHGASAFFEDGRLRSISILFIDAGAWFGFAQAGAANRVPEFLTAHRQAASALESGIAGLGAKLRDVPLGGKSLLKHTGRMGRLGDVWARLVVWPEHFVKLSLFRDEDAATQLLAPHTDPDCTPIAKAAWRLRFPHALQDAIATQGNCRSSALASWSAVAEMR